MPPVQNVAPGPVGVTVKVAVIGAFVLLTAVKFMLPVPLAPEPISVALVRVHANVVPLTVPVKVTVVVAPLHTAWLVGLTVTVGVGLTVIVKVAVPPVQPLAVGVTVNVAVTGAFVLLIAIKDILPEPLPLTLAPINGPLMRVQLKVVPDTVPVKVTIVWAPLHTVWLVGLMVTVGVGLTVIV